jgi:hypothetical protein
VGATTPVVRPSGLAWFDRRRAMALGGGSFGTDSEVGERLAAELRGTNQLSLALLVTPAALGQEGTIALRQVRKQLELVLATSEFPRGGTATTDVATLDSKQPLHLVLAFSPGRLTTFVNGAQRGVTQPLAGDFFGWKGAPLAFGFAPGEGAAWRGTISRVAIWGREITAAEAESEAARVAAAMSGEAVPRIAVEARALSVSPAPDLESISPYREALAVDEIEVVRQLAGEPVAVARLRRVRWAILDGRPLPAPAVGAVELLVLEPFAAQPQLEPYFLADALDSDAPLWFDLGGSAER